MLLLRALLLLSVIRHVCTGASAQAVPCGCDAQALYIIRPTDTLYVLSIRFDVNGFPLLQRLNNISDANVIVQGQRLRIPFSCDCHSGDPPEAMPYHLFSYTVVQGDQDNTIPAYFGNLTSVGAIDSANAPGGTQSLTPGRVLEIPINCFCGNASVSDAYGFFGTYAVQPNDSLSSLSHDFSISQELLRLYNPNISFDSLVPFGSILFIPLTNSSGQYPPLNPSVFSAGAGESSKGTIVAAVAGGGVFFVVLGLGVWFLWARYLKQSQKGQGRACDPVTEVLNPASAMQTKLNNNAFSQTWSNKQGALSADHCIDFSFDELAAATDNFSLSREIGKGGYATVFLGDWRGQKLAVKRMDLKARKEFINELAVLSSVHHANLVDLIGFCTAGYLFLVYEYIENGTLADHLRPSSRMYPMRWTTRVQIALDTARGIEYLHDHTRPTYIHCDLKPNNILIDSNFHAKVGDFGLTRLLDRDGDGCAKTNEKYGTYGYMAPEYAQFGRISVKMDVFSFGVILFQIVSGRQPFWGASQQLQSLFEGVLEEDNAEDEFQRLVDPALGTDYLVESVWKMVKLAARCTKPQPEQRPQMKEVVMQLMMLSDAHNLTQHALVFACNSSTL